MLEANSQLGVGGIGMHGNGPGSAVAMIKELQGLNVSLLAGALAGAGNALAAIRQEDTIVSALNNAAGTITDVTGTTSIKDTHAIGTVTLSGCAAGMTLGVAGVTYTAKATAADVTALNQFSISGDDTADAVALAAAINAYESNRTSQVTATANAGVVTVRAVADGVAGNAIALVDGGAGVAISGATLAGGTATGGIIVTGATDQVILTWFNKR